MKKSRLEDRLPEKFKGYESPMDVERAWEEFELRHRPDKRRRLFLLWFFFGAFAIALPLVFFADFAGTQKPSSENKVNPSFLSGQTAESDLRVNSVENCSKNEEESGDESDKMTSRFAHPIPLTPKGESTLNREVIFRPLPNKEVSLKENSNWLEIYNNEFSKLHAHSEIVENDIFNNNVFTKTKSNPLQNSSAVANFYTTSKTKNITDQNYGSNVEIIVSNNMNSKALSNVFTPSRKDLNGFDNKKNVKSDLGKLRFSEIEKIATLPLVLINYEEAKEQLSFKIFAIEEYGNSSGKDKVTYWGLSVDYGKSLRKMQATDSVNILLVEAKKEQEKPLDVLGIDFFIEQKIARQFSLKTGVGFHQYTDILEEDFTLSYTEEASNKLVEIIRSPDGAEELIYGNTEVAIQEQTQVVKYSRNRYLDIFLLGKYEISLTPKASCSFAAGVMHSFLINQVGETFKDASGTGSYIELSDLPYRKAGLWKGKTELDFNYAVGKRIVLSFGLQGNIDFSNLFKAEAGVKGKYQYWGGRFGLKRRF